MKLAVALASAALLAACADVPTHAQYHRPSQPAPRDYWGYERGQQAPANISEAEAEQLREQVVMLKAQRATLANNLPRVSDPRTRSDHIRTINDIDAQLQPLEYRLRAAGRPVPR